MNTQKPFSVSVHFNRFTHLSLRLRHPFVPGIFSLARRLSSPHSYSYPSVCDHQDRERNNKLKKHQGHWIVVCLQFVRPLLVTYVPEKQWGFWNELCLFIEINVWVLPAFDSSHCAFGRIVIAIRDRLSINREKLTTSIARYYYSTKGSVGVFR